MKDIVDRGLAIDESATEGASLYDNLLGIGNGTHVDDHRHVGVARDDQRRA